MHTSRTSYLWKLSAVGFAAFSLVACAKLEDRARGYLASTVDVFAIVDGQLLLGEAQLHGDRSGTLSIGTGLAAAPVLSCAGQLNRTGTTAAALQLQCNNGSSLLLSAAMVAETQGYAYGQGANGQPVSLTFGLAPARAVSYLRAPEGKQLLTLPKKPFLELR